MKETIGKVALALGGLASLLSLECSSVDIVADDASGAVEEVLQVGDDAHGLLEEVIFVASLPYLDEQKTLREKLWKIHRILKDDLRYVPDWKNNFNPGVMQGNVVCDYQMSAIRYARSHFHGDCDDKAAYAYAIVLYLLEIKPDLLFLGKEVEADPKKLESIPAKCRKSFVLDNGSMRYKHRVVYLVHEGTYFIVDDTGVYEGRSLPEVAAMTGYTEYAEQEAKPEDVVFSKYNLALEIKQGENRRIDSELFDEIFFINRF